VTTSAERDSRTRGTPLADRVRGLGLALGFDRVGFASARPGPHNAFLREWLARGHAGEMAWLARRVEERIDPRRLLPGARTLVAVGLAYGGPADAVPGLARYAGGEDYHRVLGDRLDAYGAGLAVLAEEAGAGPLRLRRYVDTGPVLERSAAAAAGLGWIGKNTCLIDRELGSHVFLGVLLTDLDLPPDEPEPDHCGSCRACLDACPTGAFPEPYVLDGSRCLAYTTIELREAVPEDLREPQGARWFGCDTCQDVCPWNRGPARPSLPDPLGLRSRLEPREAWRKSSIAWLLGLDEEAWREATRHTAVRRAGYRGLLRSALVAAGNSGEATLLPAVRAHLDSADPDVAEHARWAQERLALR
jgi:epoxyqueuosine reductase